MIVNMDECKLKVKTHLNYLLFLQVICRLFRLKVLLEKHRFKQPNKTVSSAQLKWLQ